MGGGKRRYGLIFFDSFEIGLAAKKNDVNQTNMEVRRFDADLQTHPSVRVETIACVVLCTCGVWLRALDAGVT